VGFVFSGHRHCDILCCGAAQVLEQSADKVAKMAMLSSPDYLTLASSAMKIDDARDLSPPSALETALARHRRAYAAKPHASADERRAVLKALVAMLTENMATIEAAISEDFGHRSAHETKLLEIFPALEACRHAASKLRGWMRPERKGTSLWFLPGSSKIIWQPLGVVVVVPWNYPLLLAVAPMASAIAAGNRVMVKMSEFTPATGKLFEALCAKYLEPDWVSVFNGDVPIAQAFVSLPFDHLLFTGSTPVGKHVMRAAANNLTPVTLELGGKSPAIIGPNYPVAVAAERIIWGKCLNAGQTCIAPDYVLVPEQNLDAFIEAARAAVATHYPTLKRNNDYTAIVNERHFQRLTGLVDEARALGADVRECNPGREDLSSTRKLAPTLLLKTPVAARVMQEEIFGPVLPVVTYRNLDEAIAYVNDRPRPLALYYFDTHSPNINRVLHETVSGGVTINDTILHIAQDNLPFGGVGPSGMGAYHGHDGFVTFSKKKPVFRQTQVNGLGLFKAPYGSRFDTLVRLLLRK
jgi:coniferyl-aldehyde dehydrogenase